MERSVWKNIELNLLKSFATKQNIPEHATHYIEQLIIRATERCGTFDKKYKLCIECEGAVECYELHREVLK